MTILKEKIITLSGTLLYGFLFLAVYILNHSVPLTEIYLGNDRTTHVKVVFIAGIIGLICLMLSGKMVKLKWLKFVGYGFSALLMFVLPVLIFIRQAGSFRGIEWAIETLIIGLVPLLFIYASFLVLKNNRIINLLLSVFFTFFSIYHLLLLLRVLPSFGRAFSSTGTSDILIMVVLIVLSAVFAFFSMKLFLNLKKM